MESYDEFGRMTEDPQEARLEARIIRVIAQTQRLPVESISIDSTFQQLNIDSLDGINIIFALENEFGVEIPDDGVHSMRSLRQIADGLRELIRAKSQRASSGAA